MKSLIEDYYAAFNAGDRERLLAMLDEHVVHEINEGGAETGREAFRAFLERMDLCYRERVEELVVFTDGSGTRAAAEPGAAAPAVALSATAAATATGGAACTCGAASVS